MSQCVPLLKRNNQLVRFFFRREFCIFHIQTCITIQNIQFTYIRGCQHVSIKKGLTRKFPFVSIHDGRLRKNCKCNIQNSIVNYPNSKASSNSLHFHKGKRSRSNHELGWFHDSTKLHLSPLDHTRNSWFYTTTVHKTERCFSSQIAFFIHQ